MKQDPNLTPGEKALTIDEAAFQLRTTRRNIDKAIQSGKLRAFFVGQRKRIWPSELKKWSESNQVE